MREQINWNMHHCVRWAGQPIVQADGSLRKNPQYQHIAELRYLTPDDLPTLGIPRDRPIYTTWQEQPELFTFMAHPEVTGDLWANLPATLTR